MNKTNSLIALALGALLNLNVINHTDIVWLAIVSGLGMIYATIYLIVLYLKD